MKAKFQEISSMLDQIKGGRTAIGLFGSPTEPQDTEVCTRRCTKDCREGAIGTKEGTEHGLEYPDPEIPTTPPIVS